MSKELQTDYLPDVVDPINYKPTLKAVLDGSGVRLRIGKYGAKLINVYGKLPGEEKFTLLATITRGTWVDKRPLKTIGIAEIRQYMVKGVEDDEEIGFYSDIVTISFGG